ncbi:hypothetical protein AB0A05_35410 [Streptomyces sp. NPDC046374]|uniref:hypothetical protein n=1 Tax=Streptomyces sp. NPDC046374 TaxID=3154917 RepID=UPI0033D3393E
MNAGHALPEDDLAALIAAINAVLPSLAMTCADLELDAVAYETGIPEEYVLALLRGEPVPDDKLNPGFTERLAFLRETRLGPDGKPFSKAYIADALGVSRAMGPASVRLHGGLPGPGRAARAGRATFGELAGVIPAR